MNKAAYFLNKYANACENFETAFSRNSLQSDTWFRKADNILKKSRKK